jgi:CRP-like cAMP-binding protein
VTEFLDGARREIEARLGELRDEVRRLEAAAAALSAGVTRRRGPGRPRGSANTARRTTARRDRRRRSGIRRAQAEKLVRESPGITISELAKKMNIKPNYLYRVLPELQRDGKVRKDGKKWHPK